MLVDFLSVVSLHDYSDELKDNTIKIIKRSYNNFNIHKPLLHGNKNFAIQDNQDFNSKKDDQHRVTKRL